MKQLKEMTFEITQKCPNNCIHCSSYSTSLTTKEIPFSLFVSVIDEGCSLGIKSLSISGGEPFVHPDIVDMVSYAKEKVEVSVYTSGITINRQGYSAPLSQEVLDNIKGIKKIVFNIPAVTESVYDAIMGTKQNFSLLKTSIERAKKAGLFMEAHFVPMDINKSEVSSVIKFVAEAGIQKISFLRLVMQGRAIANQKNTYLSPEITSVALDEIKEWQKNKQIDMRIGMPLLQESFCCGAKCSKIVIRYDGCVFPCEAYKWAEEILAEDGTILLPDNVYEKTLHEIWHLSPYLLALQKQARSADLSCPAQQLLENTVVATKSS